ncbi:putative effector of murein hydrolase LrgA (UPF0299 family) [Desmospora profundinema]|uniref:Effector of murein hydrolase LrgA (UPF0299 family) n=1 Tax=Desmospora profundinema TaxID=1571184 RepID=A0ABU1ITS9_9BACL|nr:putative effector of murein hydrolase LrgA (UPF0299 family) [Desmospora profundinema]
MFRWIKVFLQLSVLYSLYVLGNWIRETFQLVLPGSVIGMLVLFFLLFTGVVKEKWLHDGGGLLLA